MVVTGGHHVKRIQPQKTVALLEAVVYDRRAVPTILLVNPNTTAAVTEAILERAREAASPGTDLRAVTAPFGAPYVMTRSENLTAAQATLAALTANADGCDGAVIAAFSDPGLAEARARLSMPVVGIAEAAMLTACMLGARFSILTIAPRLVPVFRELAEGYGLGFSGGKDGFPAELLLRSKAGAVTPLPSKVPYTRARAGDSFIAVGPSGGGYGDPLDRDPEQVREDVLDGYLSAETALRDYGVVVTDRAELDHEATARTRQARRG
jgi:hypothetical protein